MRHLRFAALGLLGLATLGCGSSEPELHPVSGQLLFTDGRPLEGAVIEFVPESGLTARAKSGKDGRFELSTGDRPGAVAGKHRVSVIQMMVADGAVLHGKKHHESFAVDPKYAKLDTSGLTREVGPGPNDIRIELDPAPGKRSW